MIGKGAFHHKIAERVAETVVLNFNIRIEESALIHLDASLLKGQLKKAEIEKFRQQLLDKKMHGNFYRNVENQPLSKEQTFAFVRSLGLNSGTEGFIFTLVNRNRISRQEVSSDQEIDMDFVIDKCAKIHQACPKALF